MRINMGYGMSDTIPSELVEVQRQWAIKANAHGDRGSCVLGAGFEFKYKGKKYFMPPASRWQGSMSWEAFVDEIREALQKLGCVNINYLWGNMD